MKNLLLCLALFAAYPIMGYAHTDTYNYLSLNDLKVSDSTLEWIEKIQLMGPNSDDLQSEIASLQKSADPESMARLGYLYLYGLGVKKNNQNNGKAYNDYIKPAAEQGNSFAEYLLAQIYFDEFNFVTSTGDLGMVTKNYDKALSLLKKSAQAGFAPAQDQMGHIYYGDDVVQQDMSKGLEWFKKAASQGYAQSIFILGRIYYEGIGVPQDITEAKKWYKKAALEGYAPAQVSLGHINYYAMKKEEALEWMRKAADQGYAEGQYYLGIFYLNGELFKPSKEKSIMWLTKAAEQGYPDASFALYQEYDRQDNQEKAMKWLEIAANKRHPLALVNIGNIYIDPNNKGTDKIAQGLRYLEAYEYGMRDKLLPVSVLYSMAEGYDLSENYSKAITYYKKIADRDSEKAEYDRKEYKAYTALGEYYLKGLGIGQNTTKAKRWFQQALKSPLDQFYWTASDISRIEQNYYSISDPEWKYFGEGIYGTDYYYLPQTLLQAKSHSFTVLVKQNIPVNEYWKRKGITTEKVIISGLWTQKNKYGWVGMEQLYLKTASGFKLKSNEWLFDGGYEIRPGSMVDKLIKIIED